MSRGLERRAVHFGAFRLEPDGRLLREATSVPIAPKEVALLRLLIGAEGRVVPKQEILDRLWPGEEVAEASLTSCVHGIRLALGDRGRRGRYLETVHGRGYRFTAAVRWGEDRAQDASRTRVAVAPFTAEAEDDAYLAHGLAAEVTSRLARWHDDGIDAIAHQPTASRAASGLDALRLAKERQADFLVLGHVRPGGRETLVRAELVRVHDEVVVWSEEIVKPPSATASVAADIAEAVAKRLVDLRGSAFTSRSTPPTAQDPRSYHALLRGQFLNQLRTEIGLRRSIVCFEQALGWDPGCAAIHTALAEAYLNLAWRGFEPPREMASKALASITRALDLEGRNAAALALLAFLRVTIDLDARSAEDALVASAIGSESDRVSWLRGNAFVAMGRFDAALATVEAALEVNPFSPNLAVSRVLALWCGGHDDEALRAARALVAAEPEFPSGHAIRSCVAGTMGLSGESLRAAEAADGLARGDQLTRSACAWAFARAGRADAAWTILTTLERRGAHRYVSPTCVAVGYAGLGDADRALEWLARARERRCMWLPFAAVDPRFALLRERAAFRAATAWTAPPARPPAARPG